MKTRVTIHRVRLGAIEHRVVRASGPFEHALLADHDRWFQLLLDAGAAQRIGTLWLLAARSPRSLIYVPLRSGPSSAGLDLVLAHHSLGFKPHRWKRLRGRLGLGAPSTVDPLRPPVDDAAGFAARRYRENRDLFHQHVHAETLFMIGSAPVFRATVGRFFDVASHGPTWDRPPHYCAELHPMDAVLAGDARGIHVEYAPG